MQRSKTPRSTLSLAVATLLSVAPSVGLAQATLECGVSTPDTPVGTPELDIYRDTPVNVNLAHEHRENSLRLRCTGGTPGTPIEVALRVPAGVSSSTHASGYIVNSPVGGIGIVISTLPAPISGPLQVVVRENRNEQFAHTLAPVGVVLYPVKTGQIDLNTDHYLHDFPLLEALWRAPGVHDNWTVFRTWRYERITTGPNVTTETCHFGPDANVPLERRHSFPTTGVSSFNGVGSEAPGSVANNLQLTCRNFSGGRLSVDSPYARAGEPGVLDNSTGDGMATGVGVRVRDGVGGEFWQFNTQQTIPIVGNGTNNYSYYARLVQTDPSITAGRIETHMTLTVHYD